MQKIVTLGGGTGHFQILKGLKNYDCELTAVVGISDDGGSSGRLRDEYGILPPGDLRQCMVALAPNNENMILRKLFMHRFNDGHSLGNLIITAATQVCGGEIEGIKAAGQLLNVQGKVLPVSTDHCTLVAETKEGAVISGEKYIDKINGKETRFTNVWLDPPALVYNEVANAIRHADKIVFCPGDLYGSLIPNFLPAGMKEALNESTAEKVYVCNLFTKHGCYGFKASDFVREVERYSGITLDHILIHNQNAPPELLEKYFSENAGVVEDDMRDDSRVIRDNFAQPYDSTPNPILRHVPEKIARAIVQLPIK